MRRIAVFSVALLMDSIVFVLKLSVPVFIFVNGAEELRLFHKHDWNNHFSELIIVYFFVGGSFVLILTLCRFPTNWYQYTLERDEERSVKSCASHFCVNFSWLFIGIGHIAVNGTLIGLDWTECRWLTKVMIAFLCWECLMFCFMIVIKALFRHYVSKGVSQRDVIVSQESSVKKQTAN